MAQLRSRGRIGDEPASVAAACPSAARGFRLVRIVPDKQRHEMHTARCDACGEEVNSVVAIS